MIFLAQWTWNELHNSNNKNTALLLSPQQWISVVHKDMDVSFAEPVTVCCAESHKRKWCNKTGVITETAVNLWVGACDEVLEQRNMFVLIQDRLRTNKNEICSVYWAYLYYYHHYNINVYYVVSSQLRQTKKTHLMSPKSFLFPAMATTMSSGPCSFSSFTHFFSVWKESWTTRPQHGQLWDRCCMKTSSATCATHSLHYNVFFRQVSIDRPGKNDICRWWKHGIPELWKSNWIVHQAHSLKSASSQLRGGRGIARAPQRLVGEE